MNATTHAHTRTSALTSAWADIRHAQRRMIQLNRPWAAKRTVDGASELASLATIQR